MHERKIFNYADRDIIEIRYSLGFDEYRNLGEISCKHFVYLKGYQKYDFLARKFKKTLLYATVASSELLNNSFNVN